MRGKALVVAVVNQKGGVGKTTTALNLATCIAQTGRATLLVDADPQANATSGLGVDPRGLPATVYDLLVGRRPLSGVVRGTGISGLSLLPSSPDLAGVEAELPTLPDWQRMLRRALEPAKGAYRWVLIDTPPSLGVMTVMALVAADYVLIPLQCEYYAMEGLSQLLPTVERVRDGLNPGLKVAGIVLTLFDTRTRLSREVAEEVKAHFPDLVFKTVIPRSVRVAESPSHGLPVVLYDPGSRAAEAYRALSAELMGRIEGRR